MATKNTYNTKNTSKNMDEDANDSRKRIHLSGPLSVDPVSQQLIDSKYVLNCNLSLADVTVWGIS